METDRIQAFLKALGLRYPYSAQLYLLGGSALCLLGSPRPTLDIDYVGDDLKKDALQKVMDEIAGEMGLDVEAVPIERFIPVPVNKSERSLRVGKFGKIDVYIFDPYSIALSKIDRGFDTDLDDVIFLIRRGIVDFEELNQITTSALAQSRKYDLNPTEILAHLQELKNRLE
jgi:Nucleotidyltransferase of unknown function (DUF6036)